MSLKKNYTVTSTLLATDFPQGYTESKYTYASRDTETVAPKIEKSSSRKRKAKEEVAKKGKIKALQRGYCGKNIK